MAKARIRIDALLVERGLYPSRERAQAALMAGLVSVGGVRIEKAGQNVSPDVEIAIAGPEHPYVSRGGLKLAKALDTFGWDVAGLRALDLGASTGGFTDCMLQRGAEAVIAVDVGRNQLDQKIREDARVLVRDKQNARLLRADELPWIPDFITVDVSFISLTLILPVVAAILPVHGRAVTLIKPQFEAGQVNLRKGVVRDPAVHVEVLRRIHQAALELGLRPGGLTFSPLRGPAGNVEFLAGFTPVGDPCPWNVEAVVEATRQAFSL